MNHLQINEGLGMQHIVHHLPNMNISNKNSVFNFYREKQNLEDGQNNTKEEGPYQKN